MQTLEEPLVPARENHRVAIVPGNGAFDAAKLVQRYEELRRQDADLVVFGGMQGPEGWEVHLPESKPRSARTVAPSRWPSPPTAACGGNAALVTPTGTHHRTATHGRGIATGELNAEVVPTPAGNVALLCGDEGLVPEVARCLALEGLILAWPLFDADPMAERVARARSDENRVYTAAAWPGGGAIIGPNGAPVSISPSGTGIAMAAQVNKALSRWKDMAPGTNAITDRIPEAYGALVR